MENNDLYLVAGSSWRRKWQPSPVLLLKEFRGQRSLVGCCLWGRIESDTTEATQHACVDWRRKWQPTPVFLPGESQGQRSLVGCRLWGHTEQDMTEVTQQQQPLASPPSPCSQASGIITGSLEPEREHILSVRTAGDALPSSFTVTLFIVLGNDVACTLQVQLPCHQHAMLRVCYRNLVISYHQIFTVMEKGILNSIPTRKMDVFAHCWFVL